MIDILYLAHNRLEFTQATIQALRHNTDWSKVRSVLLYDDDSTDGTREFLASVNLPVQTHFRPGTYGSPVAVMNDAICSLPHDATMAKLDNDTMVPPHWLNDCITALYADWDLDLLGIESHYEVAPGPRSRVHAKAEYIGGIGLMRLRAFSTLPRPSKLYGFTAWQSLARIAGAQGPRGITCGWIRPSMQVFLLDRMPTEPWASLSEKYVANGWQRPWPKYDPVQQAALWSWWKQ